MKKLLFTASSALVLLMLLAGTVSAANPTAGAAPVVAASVANGEPTLDADRDFGYYLWYDGNQFQLRTTDRGNGPGPSEYTGKIVAHGNGKDASTITDVRLIKHEDDDSAVASGNALDFRFKTFNGIDGVAFTAKESTSVTFHLYRDGHLVSTDHIFLGAGHANPPGNPFTLFS